MNLKPIVVKEYLESLTEKSELNTIFPILLEAMNFTVLSKPSQKLGLKEYGKDIVAIGDDDDGIKKRFYFELKGGGDRNITESSLRKKDGVYESLIESTFEDFVSAYPRFQHLPLKIVIVHNGEAKGNVQSTLDNLFTKLSIARPNTTYDRWDISRLTILFSEHLFGAYLLTDAKSTSLFNRVLINLNTTQGISPHFNELLDYIFTKNTWTGYKKTIQRKWRLLFESLKLIAFVIYTESEKINNLDIAKRYSSYLIIRFWYWILKNKLEKDEKVLQYFTQVLIYFVHVLQFYLKRTYHTSRIKNGLSSKKGGRYEQVGFNLRSFDYFHYLLLVIRIETEVLGEANTKGVVSVINELISNNMVLCRPMLDIHSIPIMQALNAQIKCGDYENANTYLRNIFWYLKRGKEMYDCLPDANNSKENVVRLVSSGEKTIFYSDSTSPILAALLEYTVILNMEEEYNEVRDFILDKEVDLGLFVPFHGASSESQGFIEDQDNDLEEQLFSKSVDDGYQSEIRITKDLHEPLSFEGFIERFNDRKQEFSYEYRTESIGYGFLLDLAHYYFQTPFFPDKWRSLSIHQPEAAK